VIVETPLPPCHQAARDYLAAGLHPIPCGPRSKRPLVEWRRYQELPPLLDEIDEWWGTWPDANVALVLGRGTFAVDLDGGRAAEALLRAQGITLPPAPVSQTGSGHHVFLGSPGPVPDRVALLKGEATNGQKAPQVDIRGVGIVVAPPSIHPSGAVYAWVLPLAFPLPPAPDALLALIQARPAPMASPAGAPQTWVQEALQGVPEGQRDAMCARLAGYFLGHGLDAPTVERLLIESFARNCQPPFPPIEVRKTVHSIARRAGPTPVERPVAATPLGTVLDELATMLQQGPAPLLRTPFPGLNYYLAGGFSPGELIYIGARPGVGKTALGLELTRTAAHAGHGVLVVSREMLNLALARRLVAQEGKISATLLRRGRLEASDEQAVAVTSARLKTLPVWLSDTAISIEEITTLVTEFSATRPLGLLVVDYLQLVRAPTDVRERRYQVEAVSQGLKTLALQARLPVVCLSSLSRPVKGKPLASPTMSDLRESGELEHDADIILFLHRKPRSTETECTVAKNRDGATGTVTLLFQPDYVSFEEVSRRDDGHG
jgi:replicative DNA helicase